MWLLPTILVLTGTIIVHAALRHVVPSRNSVVQFLAIAGLGSVILALALLPTGASRTECCAALALLVFGCELYLFLFTFAISSVSVALLLEKAGRAVRIETSGETSAPTRRVERMLESGLIVRTLAGYVLTPRGQVIVKLHSGLRSFFRHEP